MVREEEREDARRQSLDKIDEQIAALHAAWERFSAALDSSGKDAETDASIAAYEQQEVVFTTLMRSSYAKIEALLEQQSIDCVYKIVTWQGDYFVMPDVMP